jgi:hypothetical protein
MEERGSGGGYGRWQRFALAAGVAVYALAGSEVLAAGGGKPAKKLVNVADTRGIEPGLSRFIADVYNSSLWLYGGLVVVTMVGMGLVLGLTVDRLMGLLGINLGKLEHHE